MKRVLALTLMLSMLCACGQNGSERNISSAYAKDVSCTARVQALSEPAIDYVLSFKRTGGVDTVEVLSPQSIKGIKATVKKGSAGITDEDEYIETLLPALWGATPIDVLSSVFDNLHENTPVRSDKNKEQIILEYAETVDDTQVRKTVWLNCETLALESADIEVAGQLILKITCTSFQLY